MSQVRGCLFFSRKTLPYSCGCSSRQDTTGVAPTLREALPTQRVLFHHPAIDFQRKLKLRVRYLIAWPRQGRKRKSIAKYEPDPRVLASVSLEKSRQRKNERAQKCNPLPYHGSVGSVGSVVMAYFVGTSDARNYVPAVPVI